MVDWNSLHRTYIYMLTWLHCVTPAYSQSEKVCLSLTNVGFTSSIDQVGLTDVLLFKF